MEKRRWYSSLTATYPSVVIVGTLVLLVACGLGAFFGEDLPSFKDPGKGFEPRGTEIKKRSLTIANIENATKQGILLNSPPVSRTLSVRSDDSLPVRRIARLSPPVGEETDKLKLCKPSGFKSSLKIVFRSEFSLDDIQAMCEFSSRFIHSRHGYDRVCSQSGSGGCCPDVSIGNVIASAFHTQSCMSLNESHITAMKHRLLKCAPWYANHSLTHNCAEVQTAGGRSSNDVCLRVPAECAANNAVYSILHYLTDTGFVDSTARICGSSAAADCSQEFIDDFPSLRFGVLLLQAGTSGSDRKWFVGLYHEHLASTEHYKGVTVAGFDLRIEYLIFQERLVSETLFPAISILLIFLIMWVYTGSLFITSMACLAIVSSIVIAYFLYMVVFQVPSFGFLNLLALIIVIGVGADDVFVYMDVWRQAKIAMPTGTMTDWVSTTLRHAALSMFVTSFTTAVAFIANIVSPITSIKTFGIFAGTAIVSNYILMISWLPAIVVVYERYFSSLCCKTETGDGEEQQKWFHRVPVRARSAFRLLFKKLLPKFVMKMRFVLVLVLGGLAIGMSLVVFFKPRLTLPTTERFQFFVSSDPLSSYILDLQDQFYFEKASDASSNTLPLILFWGVKPEDAGNAFDPDDKPLVLNYQWPKPFVIDEAMQQWFLDFCEAIKKESFYESTVTCFPTEFQKWQQWLIRSSRSCSDYRGIGRKCCNVTLPTDWQTLDSCMKFASRHTNPIDPNWYSVKFDPYGNVRAITAKIDSSQSFTRSFTQMESFWQNVEDFMITWSHSAPPQLGRGWFSGRFLFMDLQQSLFRGTLIAMAVSLGCSFAVLFITTLNIVLSLYAIVSIGGVLVSTVGTLVLLGWELGVFESVTIAIAVGLSVDFTVHFGVAYRLCTEPKKQERTVYALHHLGPAVAMAALTTFVAGSMMMPATILTYFQLGAFLMLVMTYSWLFANFFFLPICAIAGPQHRFAQIVLPASLDCYGQSASGPGHKELTTVPASKHNEIGVMDTTYKPNSVQEKKMEVNNVEMLSLPSTLLAIDESLGGDNDDDIITVAAGPDAV